MHAGLIGLVDWWAEGKWNGVINRSSYLPFWRRSYLVSLTAINTNGKMSLIETTGTAVIFLHWADLTTLQTSHCPCAWMVWFSRRSLSSYSASRWSYTEGSTWGWPPFPCLSISKLFSSEDIPPRLWSSPSNMFERGESSDWKVGNECSLCLKLYSRSDFFSASPSSSSSFDLSQWLSRSRTIPSGLSPPFPLRK